MCGIPRCGKSSWISKHKKNAIVVSPDVIRKEIFGHQFHQPANKFVFAISEAMVSLILKQGKDVIVDATHLTRSLRASWYPVVKDLIDIETQIVWVYADKNPIKNLQIAKERSSKGPKDEFVPESVLERMSSQFEEPNTIDDGWVDKIVEWKNS
jgi:predicted kinase